MRSTLQTLALVTSFAVFAFGAGSGSALADPPSAAQAAAPPSALGDYAAYGKADRQ